MTVNFTKEFEYTYFLICSYKHTIMTLQWTFVAAFLYVEIFLCIFLCLPFISAKRWQYVFRSKIFVFFVKNGNTFFIVLIAILCLLFADAVREMAKYSVPDAQEVNLSNNPNAQDHVLMKLFRAQRNFYISGFGLFLCLVLRRLALLISDTATLEANCEASRKQAESASRTAQNLMDRNDADEDESGDAKQLKSQMEELTTKLAEARKDTKAAQTDLEAIKTQAIATNKEYDRLMSEVASLQEQLGETTDKKDQ